MRGFSFCLRAVIVFMALAVWPGGGAAQTGAIELLKKRDIKFEVDPKHPDRIIAIDL